MTSNKWTFYSSADPEERVDLINDLPEVAEELEWLLSEYEEKRVPADNPDNEPIASDPANFGGFWTHGWCDIDA